MSFAARIGAAVTALKAPADTPEGLVPADRAAAQARSRSAEQAPVLSPGDAELLTRRDRLTERFAAGQAELGGILYEMAIRDHVRLDVLTRRAAELQRVDLELQEVERELRGQPVAIGGTCGSCGARHAAGARFCASCGNAVSGTTATAAPATPAAPAATLPATASTATSQGATSS